MSEQLVDFEDLALLDGGDLRAVLGAVSEDQVVDALLGTPAGLQRQLLNKLPQTTAARLECRIGPRRSISFEAVLDAQRSIIDALCRLSRGAQIAFDVPEDMVA
ncbi:MAG: hypothetical protein NVSMB14_16500 [Isosphaeraceae bacterium]